MNKPSLKEENDSIIQEIVFYDKPNLRSIVPEELLSVSSLIPSVKGDLVFCRARRPSSSTESSAHEIKKNDEYITKDEPGENDQNQDNFIKLVDVKDVILGSKEALAFKTKQSETLESEKVIFQENDAKIPRQLSKPTTKIDHEQVSKPTSERRESTRDRKPTEKKLLLNNEKKNCNTNKTRSNKNVVPVTAIKTPKNTIKRSTGKSQTLTMLNYVTINVDTNKKKMDNVKEKSVSSSLKTAKKKVEEALEKKTESVETLEETSRTVEGSMAVDNTLPKRRGRPRKQNIVDSSLSYSDEDVSFKTHEKKNSKEQIKETTVMVEHLEELLDDNQEHVRILDRVEEQLQDMFSNGEDPGTKKTRVKRKSGRTSKSAEGLAKRVKKNDEGTVRQSISLDEPEVYTGSDEDSRQEWLPSEYAEYKQKHIMKQLKKFSCKFCKNQFPSYYAMRKHRAIAHDDGVKSRKEATYREDIRVKQEHNEDSDNESREEWMPEDYADYKVKHKLNKLNRSKWYKCKICCAVFSNYYKLSKHRLEHTSKPNPYECKECDEKFKDVESLMVHIRIHQGKDPYPCKKCDKGFNTKEELDKHMAIHILKKGPIPPKRFRCDICSKEFSKLCDIERHTRVHTGEKPCECNICHKRFQQAHNLSQHLLTHLHIKPFQCDICHKKFGRIDILNRHLLTHSLEKPFNCEICRKGFIREVQLTNHMNKVHVGLTKDNENQEESVHTDNEDQEVGVGEDIETESVHFDDEENEDGMKPIV